MAPGGGWDDGSRYKGKGFNNHSAKSILKLPYIVSAKIGISFEEL